MVALLTCTFVYSCTAFRQIFMQCVLCLTFQNNLSTRTLGYEITALLKYVKNKSRATEETMRQIKKCALPDASSDFKWQMQAYTTFISPLYNRKNTCKVCNKAILGVVRCKTITVL